MKYFFSILGIAFLLNGCSAQNAFSKFDMTPQQELSASSIQSSKVKFNDDVNGVFSSIYLNEVYPDKFTQNEYFFIYFYVKDKTKIYEPNSLDNFDLTLKLNSQLPIKMKKLPANNKFSHLVSQKSPWYRYYLVAFKKQDVKKLNLILENPPYSSAELVYQKEN